MDKLYMFQDKFGKIETFGWCDLEIIPADACTPYTSTELQDKCQIRGVHLTLSAPDHKEINRQVKVTWTTLYTNEQSIMVHARFLEAYIHFSFIYTADNIFLVLPIKCLINKYNDPNTPYKLAAGMKPSIFHLRVLFFCVLYGKLLHMLVQRR